MKSFPELMDDQPHGHYFRKCPYDQIDVYRVLELFAVANPCIAHAAKKLLVTGGRGHKDAEQDVQDAIDSLKRWQQMRREEQDGVAMSVLK